MYICKIKMKFWLYVYGIILFCGILRSIFWKEWGNILFLKGGLNLGFYGSKIKIY